MDADTGQGPRQNLLCWGGAHEQHHQGKPYGDHEGKPWIACVEQHGRDSSDDAQGEEN
jgi:hypothetical protein